MSRPLGQLFFSSDILSGEEAAKLRSYCSQAYMNFDKDFKDPCGILFEDADLTAFQDYFQGRIQHFEGRQPEATQELYKLRWGPTRSPIYVALLAYTTLNPPRRYKYIGIAEWLVDTAKVPVDGTDISGYSALRYSISTKPYFDPEFAQLMLDAGGDINRRDRFGSTPAHDITTIQLFKDQSAHDLAGQALQWYLEHGGTLDVEDGEGMSVRRIIAKLENTSRTLKDVVDTFEQQRKDGKFPDSAFPKPTPRNGPCPCGSGRKFKKCCGKE